MGRLALAGLAIAGLAVGAVLLALGHPALAADAWALTTAVVLLPLAVSVLRSLLHGDVGVDAIALVAMCVSLALDEQLAGAVIAVMLAGGNALEAVAARQATRDLRALLGRVPRHAHRLQDGRLEDIDAELLERGDVVVVRAGELVPVDGLVGAGGALLDESALTGEPLPVSLRPGDTARSGTANAGQAFELRAVRPAAESAYAQIVRLVREAERSRAPLVRLADRFAALMLPAVLGAAAATWLLSGDPRRGLAVLVVATPCPLILAAPIALLAGVSRAARQGVIVKGSAAIERLGRARSVILDKTGTVTLGRAALRDVMLLDGIPAADLIRLAASLDQLSAHPVAAALTDAAAERGLPLSLPVDVSERAGAGIAGLVEGRRLAVGTPSYLAEHGYTDAEALGLRLDGAPGDAHVLVGVDGTLAGVLNVGDRLRPGAIDFVRDLRLEGVRHIALATGDRSAVARHIGEAIGVDRVHSDMTPAGKLDLVRALQRRVELRPVVMVGDGVNDAPALAQADVGIAIATPGSMVSSETADAVIADGRVERVVQAVAIGRRSLSIARQSIVAGMGLSALAMAVAAAGFIAPVQGALLQEAIDVAVILNALRALRGGRVRPSR